MSNVWEDLIMASGLIAVIFIALISGSVGFVVGAGIGQSLGIPFIGAVIGAIIVEVTTLSIVFPHP